MNTNTYSNILKMATILVALVCAWSVGPSLGSSAINQDGAQLKNQVLHQDDYYQAARGSGYMDGNKIRSYDGNGAESLLEVNGNSKRARKISTFMPMRGKKNDNNEARATLDNLMNAYSVVPLIKIRLLESAIAKQQEQQMEGGDQSSNYLTTVGANNNNNAYQDNNNQQQYASRTVGEPVNMNRYLDMDEASQSGNGQGSQLIQNKLRRAFHPMRGKKSMLEEFNPAESSLSDPLPIMAY